MYDDLVNTQKPSLLERLVVSALIPSVMVTFVMQCRSLALHDNHAHAAITHSTSSVLKEGFWPYGLIGGVRFQLDGRTSSWPMTWVPPPKE